MLRPGHVPVKRPATAYVDWSLRYTVPQDPVADTVVVAESSGMDADRMDPTEVDEPRLASGASAIANQMEKSKARTLSL